MPARVPPGANGKPGKVVGPDIEDAKLKLARQERETLQLSNVEFRLGDITRDQLKPEFALVHTRFILTHLRNPAEALKNMQRTLRPGGIMAEEGIDFLGYFCDPDSIPLALHRAVHSRTCK